MKRNSKIGYISEMKKKITNKLLITNTPFDIKFLDIFLLVFIARGENCVYICFDRPHNMNEILQQQHQYFMQTGRLNQQHAKFVHNLIPIFRVFHLMNELRWIFCYYSCLFAFDGIVSDLNDCGFSMFVQVKYLPYLRMCSILRVYSFFHPLSNYKIVKWLWKRGLNLRSRLCAIWNYFVKWTISIKIASTKIKSDFWNYGIIHKTGELKVISTRKVIYFYDFILLDDKILNQCLYLALELLPIFLLVSSLMLIQFEIFTKKIL